MLSSRCTHFWYAFQYLEERKSFRVNPGSLAFKKIYPAGLQIAGHHFLATNLGDKAHAHFPYRDHSCIFTSLLSPDSKTFSHQDYAIVFFLFVCFCFLKLDFKVPVRLVELVSV